MMELGPVKAGTVNKLSCVKDPTPLTNTYFRAAGKNAGISADPFD
jgi:hypothetical protein